MSLWESGGSTGDVSLKSLFEGTDSVAGLPDYGYEGMARNLVRGGWPDMVGMSDLDAHRKVEGYCNEIVDSGFSAEWESQRALKGRRALNAMMRSLSGATASERSAEAIRNDVIRKDGTAIGINTVHRYLDALRSIFVTDDLPAWTPDLRFKAVVRTTDARHMADPSIAAYFLDAGPDDLISDPETFGLLFESMVVRDLRVYAQTLGGHVCHYRDKDGLEADAVVLCIGITPNTDFTGNEIEKIKNGALLTDASMQTSVKDVYAAGDCATTWHKLLDAPTYIALGTNANKQGRMVGDAILGKDICFKRMLGTSMLRCIGLELAKTGFGEQECKANGIAYKTVTVQTRSHARYYPDPSMLTIKLCYKENDHTLLGAQIMGSKEAAWRIDVFACAIDQEMTTEELGFLDLGYAPPFASVWDAIHIAANASK